MARQDHKRADPSQANDVRRRYLDIWQYELCAVAKYL